MPDQHAKPEELEDLLANLEGCLAILDEMGSVAALHLSMCIDILRGNQPSNAVDEEGSGK